MTERPSARLFGGALESLHKLASYWILVIMAWIVADVAGRVFFNRPFPGTAEIVAYSLPVITFLQIPHVLRAGRHLRSPLLDERLSARTRAGFVIMASILGAALFTLAAYSSWQPMLSAWRAGEYVGEGVIRIPAGPAWTTIFASCILMTAQFLGTTAHAVRTLLRPPP